MEFVVEEKSQTAPTRAPRLLSSHCCCFLVAGVGVHVVDEGEDEDEAEEEEEEGEAT